MYRVFQKKVSMENWVLRKFKLIDNFIFKKTCLSMSYINFPDSYFHLNMNKIKISSCLAYLLDMKTLAKVQVDLQSWSKLGDIFSNPEIRIIGN